MLDAKSHSHCNHITFDANFHFSKLGAFCMEDLHSTGGCMLAKQNPSAQSEQQSAHIVERFCCTMLLQTI
jgi:hypothetical protein